MGEEVLSSAKLKTLNQKFEQAQPPEILKWAINQFGPKVGITSSFGTDSAALLHMAAQIDSSLSVRFVDTGFHFEETLRHLEILKQLLHLNIQIVKTSLDASMIAKLKKEYAKKPIDDKYCCGAYKVEATQRALAGLACWITGLQRSDSMTRKDTPIIDLLDNGMLKVAPLAAWSSQQLHAYMSEHHLPYHPLWAQGYTSIGCALHTEKPIDPNDPRSGRWAGQSKTECGIHDIGKRQRPSG